MSIISSVKLRLSMHVDYLSQPMCCEHGGIKHTLQKGSNILDLTMRRVEDVFTFKFSGFTWKDKTQKINLRLFTNSKELVLDSLTFFTREGNKGMPVEKLINYKTVFHNGTLTIKFYQRYVRSYICDGLALVKNPREPIWGIDLKYLHDDPIINFPKKADILMLGSCHLNDSKPEWTPSLSTIIGEHYPDKSVVTFSPDGVNDWTVLHNALWFIDHCEVKNLVLTLNIGGRFVAKTRFLDQTLYAPSMGGKFSEKVPNFERNIKIQKYVIKRKSLWDKLLRKKLVKVSKICADRNINIQIINYTAKDIWFKDFDYIDFYHKHLVKSSLYHPDRRILVDCYKSMLGEIKIL